MSIHRITLIIVTLLVAVRMEAQTIPVTESQRPYTIHATYYSDRFEGRRTSSGEIFRQNKYTAAHRTYKFGTLLLVTNLQNGKQVIVKVNDRCAGHNVLDLTKKAARTIGISSRPVKVQVLPPSYYTYWENQDEIKKHLQQGNLLEFLHLIDGSAEKRQPVWREDIRSSRQPSPLLPE
ncbi:MAG: septal ring lytic transglycosylase RlpA family protein [Bacteroidales bacterium]|nr:septal ring lytic transglycosylase RlpA family protein [Bacteroidales bacterium]